MTAAPRSSRLPGVPLPDGGAATPSPAHVEAGDRTVQERAQDEGPCPHCGNYGPRYILCYTADPVDCLHDRSHHKLRGDGSYGACDVTGPGGKRCGCTQFTPRTPETPQ